MAQIDLSHINKHIFIKLTHVAASSGVSHSFLYVFLLYKNIHLNEQHGLISLNMVPKYYLCPRFMLRHTAATCVLLESRKELKELCPSYEDFFFRDD